MKGSIPKKKVVTGTIGVVLGILIVGLIYFLGFGRIKDPEFCTLCHETRYDYREYAINLKKTSPLPRGVLVGCAECHPQPFREFKDSDHYNTESEDRPGCANCHTPHRVVSFIRYMYLAADPWLEVMGALHDNQKWERVVRPRLAKRVRERLLKTDSKKCRDCHLPDNFPPPDVVEDHNKLIKGEKTCIECHYNLVHKEVPWPEMEEEGG